MPYRGTSLDTEPLFQLWDCSADHPNLIHQFSCEHGAVLSLVAKGDIIAAGCQDGYVKVLDLETKTAIRTIIVQEVFFSAFLMTAG